MSENQIDREKVYAYFDKYHGPLEQSTNGYYTCNCPICGKHGKFAVNFNYLTGKCWTGCFSGFIVDVIRIYHGITYFEARELIEEQEVILKLPAAISRATKNSKIALPYGYHSILEGVGFLPQRARQYLIDRNFDLNYLDRIGVGFCDEEGPDPKESYLGRIIVPFKHDGSLNYFIGRTFIDDYERYKNPTKEKCGVGKSEVIFNEEALYLEPKIYTTEGWSCAATIGRRGTSIQGSIPSVIQRNLYIKSPVEEIVIVPDASFYLQGLMAAKFYLPHKKVKVINMDQFEIDMIGKDVNEVGLENLINQENKTEYMTAPLLYTELKKYA